MAIDAGARGEEEISQMAAAIEDDYRRMEDAYFAEQSHEPDVVQCRLCGGPEWEPETKDDICRICREVP
jgi:hypothetical protein